MAVKAQRRLIFLLSGLFCLACSDFGLDPDQQTTYQYWAFDSTGNLGARGDFTLDFSKVPTLSGKWRIVSNDTEPDMGPQDGLGRLEGKLDGETFNCNFNPDLVDNNIVLNGNLKGELISGNWSWVTFAGITKSGAFVAIKE